MLLCSVTASAEVVQIDGIWYNLITKAKQAEVTKNPNSDVQYDGAIFIPSTINHGGIDYQVTSIGDDAFARTYDTYAVTSIVLPKGLVSIGDRAFWGCSMATISMPESIRTIGKEAFAYSALESITLPKSVTSIGSGTFAYCSRLTSIAIPESVTSIGYGTFLNCSNLTTITLPKSVTSIGGDAFAYCSGLISINIPEGVTAIGDGAFQGCSKLNNINIPEGVVSIGGKTFACCSSMTSITIPESVVYIEWWAFQDCSSLISITIPEGVTAIGEGTFQGCSKLTNIVFPKSLCAIGGEAFANCPELTDVYCHAESVPSVEATAFDGSYPEYATLHVPASAYSAYKTTAPWNCFGEIVTIDNVTLEKCVMPTISYKDGKIVFSCDTEGATIKSSINENITGTYNDMEVAFTPTYTITAYATKPKYENSDEVSLTLCWVPCTEEHKSDDTNGVISIPSKPVLIQSNGSTITLTGLAEGTKVKVYDLAGNEIGTATATNGTATIATNLEAGITAIVKIGEHSVKVAIK